MDPIVKALFDRSKLTKNIICLYHCNLFDKDMNTFKKFGLSTKSALGLQSWAQRGISYY